MAKKGLAERLRKKQEGLKGGGGNYKFFIFPEGITRLRHLPAPPDEEFAVEVQYLFFSKDIGGFICPSTWGDKSAFKETFDKLNKSKKDSDKNLAKKIKSKRKFCSLAIRYKDSDGKEVDTEAGIKPALLSPGQYNDMIDLFLDEDSGDFTHPDDGYDLKHKRVGKGQFDTEYSILKGKVTKLAKAYRGKTYDPVEAAKKLTPTYKETVQILEQFFNLESEPDEKEKSSIKKKKKKSRDL